MASNEIFSSPQASLSAVTTGTGTAIPINRALKSVIYVKWSSGCSAGTIVIEVADLPTYTGTWRTFSTVPWVAASTTDVVNITEPVGAVRARITSNIVGGTITASVQGYD